MLLDALASGELSVDEVTKETRQESVKEYDFRRPNKFSNDQLRTLHMIHDNFARMVSNFLSAYLRSSVQVKIASVDQLTYEDFLVSIPSPTLMTVFSMQPLKGTAVLETNPALVFPIIDLLFGGPGEMPGTVRELTDIEMSVLRKLNAKILENLAYAWTDIFQFSPEIEAMETNPHFNQVMSPNETVAIVTLSTTIGNSQGMINLCLPFVTLETVISKLTAHFWLAHQETNGVEQTRRKLLAKINSVPLELTAIAGETELTIRDFLQLQEGDVIPLDKAAGTDLVLLVEDKPKFKVQPGFIRRRMGVQITAVEIEGEV